MNRHEFEQCALTMTQSSWLLRHRKEEHVEEYVQIGESELERCLYAELLALSLLWEARRLQLILHTLARCGSSTNERRGDNKNGRDHFEDLGPYCE